MRMNVKQTAQAFGVSTMSVWNWTRGVIASREKLPITGDATSAWIEVAHAKKYAKQYGLPFTAPTAADLVVARPGPKLGTKKCLPEPTKASPRARKARDST